MNQADARLRRDPSRRVLATLLYAVAIAGLGTTCARAVVLADSPTRNTGAPTGSTNEPWTLQGQFGSFLGTPIAPNLFVAAQHIGGGVGQTFTVAGQSYVTTKATDLSGTDLRVWEIDTLGGTHAFARYATLYDANASGSEAGKPLFVVGRGTARGEAYVANGTQRGWLWGAEDSVQSWGASTASAIVADPKLGQFVAFDFAKSGGVALASGDSSGGLFVFADGQWQLAGVNYGTDGGWSTSAAGPFVNASVFDARGLYVGNTQRSQFVATDATNFVGSSYASRISSSRPALDSIFLATGNASLVPEPTSLSILIALAAIGSRRRTVR